MRNMDDLFAALSRSSFRSRFKLNAKDRAYLAEKGLPIILTHARQFINERLAPANPKNDGKQTPMRNHPVFVAQHATGTCCRKCLSKWHHINYGTELNADQRDYVIRVIERWLGSV